MLQNNFIYDEKKFMPKKWEIIKIQQNILCRECEMLEIMDI